MVVQSFPHSQCAAYLLLLLNIFLGRNDLLEELAIKNLKHMEEKYLRCSFPARRKTEKFPYQSKKTKESKLLAC